TNRQASGHGAGAWQPPWASCGVGGRPVFSIVGSWRKTRRSQVKKVVRGPGDEAFGKSSGTRTARGRHPPGAVWSLGASPRSRVRLRSTAPTPVEPAHHPRARRCPRSVRCRGFVVWPPLPETGAVSLPQSRAAAIVQQGCNAAGPSRLYPIRGPRREGVHHVFAHHLFELRQALLARLRRPRRDGPRRCPEERALQVPRGAVEHVVQRLGRQRHPLGALPPPAQEIAPRPTPRRPGSTRRGRPRSRPRRARATPPSPRPCPWPSRGLRLATPRPGQRAGAA
ncbi:MAG: hypothetical protein RIT45_2518, partial [Pseudomonadota bacterium]